jgi:polyketide synthase PksJ
VISSLAELPTRFAPQAMDWLLSVANLKIIDAAALALPRLGTINFHDGLLPRFSGSTCRAGL